MVTGSPIEQSIALNRFGLGARPDETPPADPRAWLVGQMARFDPRPEAIAGVPDWRTASKMIGDMLASIRAARKISQEAVADAPSASRAARDLMTRHAEARFSAAVASDTPFIERLVHFWANHFAISLTRVEVIAGAGPFEFETIRPRVLGRFSDLLAAVETHPVMLIYLDQASSIGPSSERAARVAARATLGLNENLAREILELHTLGVRSGYSQQDVTEFARALTGWTVAGVAAGVRSEAPHGQAIFLPEIHEPGDRALLGQRFPAGGREQVAAMLDMLALRPETARHLCTKLARHFVADAPPPALVTRLERVWLSSGGDLGAVTRALIEAPEAWVVPLAKFKSPWDWLVSAGRALNIGPTDAPVAIQTLYRLGQPMWKPGSPAGWPDRQQNWAGPDELMRRLDAAQQIAGRNGGGVDGVALAPKILPGVLSRRTADVIATSSSPREKLAMLLVSPEFQRR